MEEVEQPLGAGEEPQAAEQQGLLLHGVVRARGHERALAKLIERPPRHAGKLARILEVAATEILFMDVADHASVSIAIDQVAADRSARRYKGLANAVLRRLTSDRDTFLADLDDNARDTPDWLWRRWSKTYGERNASLIAAAHRAKPALDITVKSDPAGWADRLGGLVLPTGTVRTTASGPVERLPGFAEGAWWVQDAAAALPARLFGDIAGKRIAIFGFAFKADTGDTRESPAIKVCRKLASEHAKVVVSDPKAIENAKLEMPDLLDQIEFEEDLDLSELVGRASQSVPGGRRRPAGRLPPGPVLRGVSSPCRAS